MSDSGSPTPRSVPGGILIDARGRLGQYGPYITVFLLALAPFVVQSTYLLHLSILAMVYCIAATGLAGLLGYCGQYSIAQGAFVGIGAYTAAIATTRFGLPVFTGIPIAMVVAAIAGVILGLPSLRMAGHFLAITTVAFQVIATLVMSQWYSVTGGSNGLSGIPKIRLPWIEGDNITQLSSYYIALAASVVLVAVVSRILTTRNGRIWLAIQGDELLAKSLGINTTTAKLAAFALSAAYGGAAGAILVQYMGGTHPAEFTIWTSVTLLAMVLIGGRQSPFGAAIGAAILTLLPEFLRVSDEFRLLLYGIILVLVVRYFPFGLFGSEKARRTGSRS